MATFDFPIHNITRFDALVNALEAEGVADAVILMNGVVHISTDIGTELECQTAVDNAADDGLVSAKIERLKEVEDKSKALASEGALFDGVHFPIDDARFDFSYYEALVSTIERTPSQLPFTLETVDGIDTLTTLQQVIDLAAAATDRIRYIYLEQLNDNLSYGALGYIIAIKTAADLTALDAIVDTRI